jgi:hypothetical protein
MNPEPTPTERARALRARRRSRILHIRRRVAAASLAAFIALFSTIYIQMASGNDPALATKTTKAKATTTHAAPTTTQQSQDQFSEDQSSASQSVDPAPVTTSQS